MIETTCEACHVPIVRKNGRCSKRCKKCQEFIRRECRKADSAKHYMMNRESVKAKTRERYRRGPTLEESETAYVIPAMDVKPHPLYFKFISGQMR